MVKSLLKTVLLLCALVAGSGNVWADDTPVVTADFTAKTANHSAYTDTWTYGDWSLTKCANNNGGWAYIRCGGKGGSLNSSTNTSATIIKGTKSITKAISEVKISHNGTNNAGISINSIVLDVSKKPDFSTIDDTETLTPTISTSTAGTVSFKEDAPYATGSYYRITINWTVTGKSNYGLDVTKVEFYEAEISVSSLSIITPPTKVRYEVGETLDMSGFVLDADGDDVSTGYTMTIGETAITNGATLSSAGKKTITIAYGGKEVTQNISVGAVTGISVTTEPTKTSYDTGDSFDPTGMVVTASLSTGEPSEPDTWEKVVTSYTIDPDGALDSSDDEVTITYAEKSTTQAITVTDVAVTGVSVKESTTIEKGKTETLTATISPTNATNKAVTWESDNTTVATVTDAGVVTAVAAGTANITVTTSDGGYEATCVVTVVNQKGSIDAPYSVAEVIEMNPTSTSSATKTDVYVKGYIVGCCNTSTGAIITATSSLNDTNLALVDDPSDTDNISVQLSSGTNRNTFNVKDHPYFMGVVQILVKADVFKYCGIPGLKNIDEMSAVLEKVTVTNAGYATYVSNFGLDFSNLGVKAYQATVSGTDITFNKVTEVPAGEGVLLQGEGTFVVPVKSVDAWDEDDNAFVRGTGEAVATGSGPYNYILNNVGGVVGFYKAAGQTVAKNRAYLQTTTNQARIAFNFDDDISGIDATTVKSEEGTVKIYNLQGQRIAKPTKGLYIVNGKKIINK